jgi:hypothetical protein
MDDLIVTDSCWLATPRLITNYTNTGWTKSKQIVKLDTSVEMNLKYAMFEITFTHFMFETKIIDVNCLGG